jgi:DNA-binding CsgD family transcriptional regulator
VLEAFELVEEIRGADGVRGRVEELAGSARRAVWSLNPAMPLAAEVVVANRGRGVCSRTVYPLVAAADPVLRGDLVAAVAAGDEVRLHPEPPLRLLLVDGECAVFPVDTGDLVYVLHGTGLVAPLVVLFEQVWAAATRLGRRPAEHDEARLRRVVTMLAEGHKDEAVARRMGVSVRTARRLITASVDRLQAQSRFQAGVLAVRAGWIPGPRASPPERPPDSPREPP